jgi:hypothetical protein
MSSISPYLTTAGQHRLSRRLCRAHLRCIRLETRLRTTRALAARHPWDDAAQTALRIEELTLDRAYDLLSEVTTLCDAVFQATQGGAA